MAGRSSQSDNRGSSLLGFFVSGKSRDFHTFKSAAPFAAAGMSASGGVISDYTSGSDVFRAHVFTSSGTFAVTELLNEYAATVEFLLIAGGC